uniref:V-type proton ATPase subunit F n=1 Tax=Rhodosorus marinus TaxID=101924 RepID=A0A7S0BLT2_9RHOD|mmetsp:Transcript_22981/g.33051  ORF Transcript_22981/g.33051 Transcript_22981/m.33051 type:complete len:124 (+) Transcript_22981:25-396(+)
MAGIAQRDKKFYIAVIGDEDTVTGFLLSGIGNIDSSKNANFFVVDLKETSISSIEDAFKRFTRDSNMAVVLINQNIANEIRAEINSFKKPIPAVLEIPSKEHPYNATQDGILQRVRGMLGQAT